MSRQDDRLAELERQLAWLRSRLPVPLAAVFLDSAATAADDLRVRAFGYDDGEHTFGPVRWSPTGGELPQAGDEAVIVERDDGVWQVVAWWNDSQGTGVAQSSLDALDTRLDAAEAAATALDARADALEGTTKTAFPYGAGWADRGSGFEAVTYSKHGQTVSLQGLATKTGGAPAAGNTIGTLPSGHRPAGVLMFEVATGATDSRGRVNIASTGVVTWEAGSATETDYVSLSGISFDV